MRRGALVLLLGLAVGLATHVVYFRLHRPAGPGTLEGELSWMKAELQLSNEQYARIRELHEASSPRLRALAAQVAQMQTEFAAFVQARRTISAECLESTRQLVQAAAGEMNPAQRARYFGIVAASAPPRIPAND
jgi:hypothetical protein